MTILLHPTILSSRGYGIIYPRYVCWLFGVSQATTSFRLLLTAYDKTAESDKFPRPTEVASGGGPSLSTSSGSDNSILTPSDNNVNPIILDTLGLQQTYEALANSPSVKAAAAYLRRLGEHV